MQSKKSYKAPLLSIILMGLMGMFEYCYYKSYQSIFLGRWVF